MPKELFDFEKLLRKTQSSRRFAMSPGNRVVSVPLTVTTNFEGDGVLITWSVPGVSFSTGYYNLFRNNQFYAAIQNPATTSFSDGDVIPGAQYTYRLEFYFS